jgi:hypothetical protein
MQRSDAKRIVEVARAEKNNDLTKRDKGYWSLGSLGTITIDNKSFSSYDEMIDYLETYLEETSGGYGDDFSMG